MGDTKDQAKHHANILGTSGLSSKSVTSLNVHQNGSTIVFEVGYSGGSTFLKVNGGVVEIGGNQDFGTGTKVNLG